MNHTTYRHVRTTKGHVKDQRVNGRKYPNKIEGKKTFCNSPPSDRDYGKGDAMHFLSPHVLATRPDWSAEMCPICREEMVKLMSSAAGRRP